MRTSNGAPGSGSRPDGDGSGAGEDLAGQVLVEHGHLLGALPAGGADRISANPLAERDDESALDNAAMEFGSD